MYAASNMFLATAAAGNLVLAGGAMASFTTATHAGSIYFSVPTNVGVNTELYMKDGVTSLTAAGKLELTSQSAADGVLARLAVGGASGNQLVGFSNSFTSLYAEGNTFISSQDFVSLTAAQSIFSRANAYYGLAVTGDTGSDSTVPTASTGQVSIMGSFVTLGSAAACASGSGAQCSSGGGQVKIPNSALVLSSRKSLTCSSSPQEITAAELMTYAMVVIPPTCASGYEFSLPTPLASMEGTHITFIYDFYALGTFPSSPTAEMTSTDYVTLKFKADSGGSTFFSVRVPARAAVTLLVYGSSWSGGGTKYTYAVVGGFQNSLSAAPWTYNQ
jgi:hypothetical protein